MPRKSKYKIATAMILFLFIPTAFILAGLGLYTPQSAFRVTMDDQFLGYVETPDQYGEIIRAVYQRAEDYWQCQLMMNEEVRATKVAQWVPESSASFVQARLDATATYITSGWAISVNGQHMVYVETEAAAQELLERVQEHFTPRGDNRSVQSVFFLDTVELVRVPIEPEELSAVDTAFDLLISGQAETAVHVVQRGETLSSIARSYNTSVGALRRANDISGDTIGIGQVLNLESYEVALRVKTVEHVTATESIPRPLAYRSNPDISVRGDQVVQGGSDGIRDVVYRVESVNGRVVGREVVEKVVTREPVTRIIMPGSGYHHLRPAGMFRFPLNSGRITSYFGEVRSYRNWQPHRGIDIAASRGTPIYAAADGVVDRATYHHSWGNYVRIQHSGGYSTLYAHVNSFASGIRPGAKVVRGQVIAYVGKTGHSYGTHLHFEISRNGNLVNPLNYYR